VDPERVGGYFATMPDAQTLTITEAVLAASVAGVVRLSQALTDVEHAGTLGLLREALVESVICPLLQPPYKAATGVVIDCEGKQSGQCDIIIWDDSIFRPFYFARGAGLFGIESVLATIEVKSTLTSENEFYATGGRQGQKSGRSNDFAQVLRNAERLWSLRWCRGEGSDPMPRPPANLIFGFRTPLADPKADLVRVAEDLQTRGEITGHAGQYVQGVVVPGKTSWLYGQHPGEPTRWMSCEPDPTDFREVRVVLTGFLNSLAAISKTRGRPWIGRYTSFTHGPT
jgi:hypothetical protein